MVCQPPVAVDRPDVLIVEDNPDGREALRLLLRACGYTVEVAEDGAEGVRKGLELRPLAAVVDIGLPILDGLDVARELRRVLGGSVLLIAHTAYSTPEWQQRAIEAGFNCFLCKPCEVADLLQMLRSR